MPRVCEFFGIIISMYYNDHLPPHFHAIYNRHEAKIGIETLGLLEGKLPQRVLSMILEWGFQYRKELRKNWNLARDGKPLKLIKPLI